MTSSTSPLRRLLAAAQRATRPARTRSAVVLIALVLAVLGAGAASLVSAPSAAASPATSSSSSSSSVSSEGPVVQLPPVELVAGVTAPAAPVAPGAPTDPAVSVNINGVDGKPSSTITMIIVITLLSAAPALLLMCTAFTKIIVVLSITRNALGLMTVPPNQVLAGLALFLSLFVMAPVINDINQVAVQPFLAGTMDQTTAYHLGVEPLRTFMLAQTRGEDLALITRAADRPNPANPADVPLLTLIPAFVLSELRAAFIIGFVILVPFLVIDVVVSGALMAMGMMMLPPVTVSLPFKLLLFVLVNGWGLIVTALVGSYA
ncbi:flagellar biosynthetic protein FliP [Quadrisphaera granulorum]|uniref:Flagellar biosynthetic protein FliP n=1 Tax=Quadrisphaera granulorum TaxID=317664 RepID=A0A316A4V8_9ACTN|nr:flagellar type III secretion system pore protein FliP [Quadrisphaera granulorum]PWJ52579.1 flagellar biosynthetic protein FliP [Quadrisphaera granulorum]SZE97629.1 flagellar biosynthetic protein FliP [Quadrisphaera granulorum]